MLNDTSVFPVALLENAATRPIAYPASRGHHSHKSVVHLEGRDKTERADQWNKNIGRLQSTSLLGMPGLPVPGLRANQPIDSFGILQLPPHSPVQMKISPHHGIRSAAPHQAHLASKVFSVAHKTKCLRDWHGRQLLVNAVAGQVWVLVRICLPATQPLQSHGRICFLASMWKRELQCATRRKSGDGDGHNSYREAAKRFRPRSQAMMSR